MWLSETIRPVSVVRASYLKRWIVAVGVLAIGSLSVTSGTMAASARASNPVRALPWGREIQIAGRGNPGVFTSLSCAARGSCTAVGYWSLIHQFPAPPEGFIVDETRGKWGTPFVVPGLDANQLVGSSVTSVSCRAPGTCAAGGSASSPHGPDGFLVNEKGGVWGDAQLEPGPVEAVSCATPGNCTAVGGQTDAQGFVVDETNGVWGTAQDVPGLATLSGGSGSYVDLVSCTAIGDCSAAGRFPEGHVFGGFVVDESHGVWGNAEEVPGFSSLHSIYAGLPMSALSCAGPGDCAAIGNYETYPDHFGAFVVDESGGIWRVAKMIPGVGALNAVSCWAVARCDAVATAGLPSGVSSGVVVEERAGRWGHAHQIPGLLALVRGGSILPTTISCDSTGDCAAGGVDGGSANFIVDKVGGVWHDAAIVRNGDGQSTIVTCLAGDHCVVATDAYKPVETGEVASGPILPRPR